MQTQIQVLQAQNGGTGKQEGCVCHCICYHVDTNQENSYVPSFYVSVLSGKQVNYLGKPEISVFHKQKKVFKCICPIPRNNYF